MPLHPAVDHLRSYAYFLAVTQQPETDRFLRAAVKCGLRLQQVEADQAGAGRENAGVRTLQRIKASLRKSKPLNKTKA